MNAAAVSLIVVALTGPLQDADTPNATSAARQGLIVERCVVKLIDDISVPAREAGLLNEVTVKEGDEVQAGNLLGKLDDKDAKTTQAMAGFEVTIAQRQADSTVEVDAAEKAAEVAQAEWEESQEINTAAPGTITVTQIRREYLTVERARFQHQAAIIQNAVAGDTHHLKKAQLEAATNRVNRHEIRSPIDGVVAQIVKRPGHWLQPGDPVLRLVRMNRLRVEGMIEGDIAAPAQIAGQPVVVTVKRGVEGDMELKGVVSFVSPIVEANEKFRVWVEVDNQKINDHWAIRPGQEATMDIRLAELK